MTRRNITIAVDEDLARWAWIQAAKCDRSVSQLLAELIQRERQSVEGTSSEGYREDMEAFFAIEPGQLRKPCERMPTRDELHDR